jgi:cell division protein FtsI/penicillin-binding protein 2
MKTAVNTARRRYGFGPHPPSVGASTVRLGALGWGFALLFLALVLRLGYFQLFMHGTYEALALGQRDLYEELFPKRGDILALDARGEAVPLATNRFVYTVWADPRQTASDAERIAGVVADLLGWAPATEGGEAKERRESLIAKLRKEQDPYEPIERAVESDTAATLDALALPGIHTTPERIRFYPEGAVASAVTGFASMNDTGSVVGRYGLEASRDEELAGAAGFAFLERDAKGSIIVSGTRERRVAQDGSDLLLTIERAVQHATCGFLEEGLVNAQADRGSAIVLDPHTGDIVAMCSVPSYDPNQYGKAESIASYNNVNTFYAYEPGSVFKPLIMASAIDMGAVSPETSFDDTGEVRVDNFTIRNANLKSYGRQSMVGVLVHSINTGMVFVMRKMGPAAVESALHSFGFGTRTGIALPAEAGGDLSSLESGAEIYAATAAYGQGVLATPLQLALAYGALANDGTLMAPRLVREERLSTGEVRRVEPVAVRRVVRAQTAQTVAAMMVSVTEGAGNKTATLPRHFVAGKTGTAQVASPGGGYKADETNATFAGFFPVRHPAYVVVVRLDHPRKSQWADVTAAPVFQKIADFLVQYKGIPFEK